MNNISTKKSLDKASWLKNTKLADLILKFEYTQYFIHKCIIIFSI